MKILGHSQVIEEEILLIERAYYIFISFHIGDTWISKKVIIHFLLVKPSINLYMTLFGKEVH